MDRLEAMTAFALAAEAGGLSRAARKLGCSPAAVTRAVASLEEHVGVPLLTRTTRKVALTEAGERYLVVCRRVLADLVEAREAARGDAAALRGSLTVTAPVSFGARHVRPIVDEFLAAHPDVSARLLLVDRVVDLVDEGVDAAVRIGFMPDSSLLATKVGTAHRVVCASAAYCARHGEPRDPRELMAHPIIAFTGATAGDTWTFGAGGASKASRHVKVTPRLVVNTAEAAIGSTLDGTGVTRVLSYQVASELAEGRLVRLLAAFEPEPMPIHFVQPAAGGVARIRAFAALAIPRLREALAAPRGTRSVVSRR